MKDVLRKWLSLSYDWLDNPLMRREHTWDENCNEWGQNHGLEQREKEPSPWKRRISYDIQLWDVFQRYQKRCREGEGEVPTLRKNSGDKEKEFRKIKRGRHPGQPAIDRPQSGRKLPQLWPFIYPSLWFSQNRMWIPLLVTCIVVSLLVSLSLPQGPGLPSPWSTQHSSAPEFSHW